MAGRYQTPSVRKNLSNKLRSMEECEKNPIAYAKIQDKMQFAEDKNKIQKQVLAVTPPDATPEMKDTLNRRIDVLKEAWIEGKPGVVPAWPTRLEEEKVPAGIIGQGIKHDQFWKRHTLDQTGAIIDVNPQSGERGLQSELKDLLRVVHKEDEDYDPDIANLERFRKAGNMVPLADTRLPQSYALSTQAKENYDKVFPDHTPTPVEAKIRASKIVKKGRKERAPRVIAPGTPMCQAVRTDGAPCDQPAMTGTKHCFSRYHRAQIETAPVAAG